MVPRPLHRTLLRAGYLLDEASGEEIPGSPERALPHGRVLRDASVSYAATSDAQPPLGHRDFALTVGIYDDVLRTWPTVGRDAAATADEEWLPPCKEVDPITGKKSVYDRGEIREPLTGEPVEFYERAAVYDWNSLLQRLAEVLQ